MKKNINQSPVAGSTSRVERLFGKRESWRTGRQRKPCKKNQKAGRKPDNGVDKGQGPYRGFLMVECEECGRIKCTCAKRETYSHKCECGHVTALEKMRFAYMECKCGKKAVYRTNCTGKIATGNCVECQAPVDLELNRSGSAFVTIV